MKTSTVSSISKVAVITSSSSLSKIFLRIFAMPSIPQENAENPKMTWSAILGVVLLRQLQKDTPVIMIDYTQSNSEDKFPFLTSCPSSVPSILLCQFQFQIQIQSISSM